MKIRVYYEDTDLAGIVYYANYLRYIERGRTEYLRDRGINQMALKTSAGIVFAVRKLEADYLKPAVMDDMLDVKTEISDLQNARLVMDQNVLRDGELLFKAKVTIVCLTERGRPTRIPENIRIQL